jgi:AGCS family alanine or glycine:cation symporter
MVEMITQVNNAINGVVWGPFGLALLFCTGFWMSARTGFFQFRKMGYWLRHTIGAIFTNKDITAHTSKEDMAISQFQSMCTALAGTIGTGNIVGVATAIVSGGPGAIFWMWVMALLGMMTSFSENVLGVYYRRKNEKGEWSGGAMYYLTDGLGAKKGCKQLGKVLAVLFAAFCALASFGIGNLSQLNSIAGNLKAAFGVPEAVTGAVLAAVSAVILLGGLKRVAAVAERLVPAMALLYIVGALTVVGVHITAVPAALAAIVKGAFGLRAAGGGIVGYGLSRAVTWGFKRGAFSNEAGLGSSVMVHAASNVKEPVQQGMWGIFEVFADTMVVCTLTALVVLTSGFVEPDTGRIAAGAAGSALVGQAFDAVFGTLGSKLIAVCILLFAYSTALGWSCYGCKAVEYLFGAGAGAGYRVLFVALMPVGAVMRLDLAWTLSDTFNGLMMLPNLIGVIALSGTVVRITQNYLARKLHGSAAPPLLSAGETI